MCTHGRQHNNCPPLHHQSASTGTWRQGGRTYRLSPHQRCVRWQSASRRRGAVTTADMHTNTPLPPQHNTCTWQGGCRSTPIAHVAPASSSLTRGHSCGSPRSSSAGTLRSRFGQQVDPHPRLVPWSRTKAVVGPAWQPIAVQRQCQVPATLLSLCRMRHATEHTTQHLHVPCLHCRVAADCRSPGAAYPRCTPL